MRILAQARASARGQVHEAIEKLREEGARRLTRAKAQLDTEAARARAAAGGASGARCPAAAARGAGCALARAAKAAGNGPRRSRGFAQTACRPAPGASSIRAIGARRSKSNSPRPSAAGAQTTFQAGDIAAGLRISADQAVLDATPQGLLADATRHRRAAARRDRSGAMSEAVIRWIGGPVLHARVTQGDFRARRGDRGRRRAAARRGDPPQGRRIGRPGLRGHHRPAPRRCRARPRRRAVGAAWARPARPYLRRPVAPAR